MNFVFIFSALVFSFTTSFAQFYSVRDFTTENLFTSGIEGPVVRKDGNIFVVNVQKEGTIGLVHPDGTAELFNTLPTGSVGNSIMLDADDNLLVADYKGHNILKIHKETKVISVYAHNDQFNQPNDLCINKKGQLFASDPNWKESTGKLWRIDNDGSTTLLIEQMGTTNGIELSPNEKILYVNESVQRTIWQFDVDSKGNISNKRLFFRFEDFGLDGMKCDRNGSLYVARHGKGTVAIISRQGKLIREVTLKGKKVSNIAFGGKDGRTCYVTMQDRGCLETFLAEFPGRSYTKN